MHSVEIQWTVGRGGVLYYSGVEQATVQLYRFISFTFLDPQNHRRGPVNETRQTERERILCWSLSARLPICLQHHPLPTAFVLTNCDRIFVCRPLTEKNGAGARDLCTPLIKLLRDLIRRAADLRHTHTRQSYLSVCLHTIYLYVRHRHVAVIRAHATYSTQSPHSAFQTATSGGDEEKWESILQVSGW